MLTPNPTNRLGETHGQAPQIDDRQRSSMQAGSSMDKSVVAQVES